MPIVPAHFNFFSLCLFGFVIFVWWINIKWDCGRNEVLTQKFCFLVGMCILVMCSSSLPLYIHALADEHSLCVMRSISKQICKGTLWENAYIAASRLRNISAEMEKLLLFGINALPQFLLWINSDAKLGLPRKSLLAWLSTSSTETYFAVPHISPKSTGLWIKTELR